MKLKGGLMHTSDKPKIKKANFQFIAGVVKAARVKKGISQARIHRELYPESNSKSNAAQFISNIERGLCGIPAEKIYKLSQILDVPFMDLVNSQSEDYRQTLLKGILNSEISKEEFKNACN